MTFFRLVLATCGLLLGASAGASEAAPCSFSSDRADLEWAKVSPTGSKAFTIRLDKRPLTATPGANGVSKIEVESPLRFSATQSSNQLGARLERRTVIAEGRVVLAKGLRPSFVSQAGEEFEALSESGAIASRVPLAGLIVESPLSIPCESISIAHHDALVDSPSIRRKKGPISFVNTDSVIHLYENREAVNPLAVRLQGSWSVVAQRGDWVRLRTNWSDGSFVRGWAKKADLIIQRGVAPEDLLGGIGGISGRFCGGGHRSVVTGVKIHSHAPIHDGPGGAIWAHTAGDVVVQVFSVFRADGWIQVAEVHGLPKQQCSEHNRIWVHAKHILWSPVVAAR